jgi:hypothetical protein
MPLVHVRPKALARTIEAHGAVIQMDTAKRIATVLLRLLLVELVRILERAPCCATAARALGSNRLAGEGGLHRRTSDHHPRAGQVLPLLLLLLLLLHHVVMSRHWRRHYVRRGRGRRDVTDWAWRHRRRHQLFLLILLVLHPLLLTRVDATESRNLEQRHRGGGVALLLLLHILLLLVVRVLGKQHFIVETNARGVVAVRVHRRHFAELVLLAPFRCGQTRLAATAAAVVKDGDMRVRRHREMRLVVLLMLLRLVLVLALRRREARRLLAIGSAARHVHRAGGRGVRVVPVPHRAAGRGGARGR